MEIQEMREMPPRELESEAEKLGARIWKMRFQAKGEPVENPGALKHLKKERARLRTILREKAIAASAGAAEAGEGGGGGE